MKREKLFVDFYPSQGNVYHRADGATEKRWQIPSHWFGSIVLFSVKGAAVHILFGQNDVTIDPAAVSSNVGEVLTADTSTGDRVPADSTMRFYVPKRPVTLQAGVGVPEAITHFAVEGEDAAAEWFAYPVTQHHLLWDDIGV